MDAARITGWILVLSSLTLCMPVLGENVSFPDPWLEGAVREELGIYWPTPISYGDLLQLTELGASDRGITNLSGLGHAQCLQKLYLTGNPLTDLSPIKDLSSLETLSLGWGPISDLSPLADLSLLRNLGINDADQVSDISPLASLAKLEYMIMTGTKVEEVSALSGLSNLWFLGLPENRISDLSGLSTLSNLLLLDLGENCISDVSPLSGLNALNGISILLWKNEIMDISALTEIGNLEILDIRYNPLNSEAYDSYIPLLESRGVSVMYDPAPEPTTIVLITVGALIGVRGKRRRKTHHCS